MDNKSQLSLKSHFGGSMEKQEVKITIDPNGNIHREVIDQTQPEVRRPRLLKRLVSTLTL